MKINPNIFREYDIRGIAGKDLNAEFAESLGRTYATWALQKLNQTTMTIAVGRDCRLTSDDYASSLIRGLRGSGINVIDIGVCPSPLTYFSVFHYDLDGAIMITGSHNPADYNGFKIGFKKDTLHGEQIQELKRIFLSGQFIRPKQEGSLESRRIIEPYVDYVSKNVHPKKKLKVVLDAGNGTASTVAPNLFSAMGAEVIPLYCELDGRFPNHHPDPTVPKNLAALVAEVKRVGADFGVGYDGDSDRIGAVDGTGRILYGDELMVVFSREVLKYNPGATIISEVKSSHRLYQDIARKGGQPIMWKTGHSLIKSKMKQTGAKLAGEMSGHIFFGDRWFGFDDAIYASARLYEIIGESGSLASLIADLPSVFNTPEIRIDCQEEMKFSLIQHAAKLLQDPQGKSTDIDGLRVDYSDRWGLLRASNTQPVIVMRFEAQTQDGLKEIRSRFESALQAAAQEIGHAKIDFS
jgi:phosphomannomutase/phosphoglucomutase